MRFLKIQVKYNTEAISYLKYKIVTITKIAKKRGGGNTQFYF